MSNQPPRLATWLLKHFGCSPNTDAVIGDLDERFRDGRSRIWYWKQVLVGLAVGSGTQLLVKGQLLMKRTAVWTLILAGVFTLVGTFSLGFWIGKMPMYQEVPKVNYEGHWRTRAGEVYGTTEFLQMELDKAQTRKMSQEQIADLRRKLEAAKLAEEIRPGR
jgi:hypothetical protein